MAIGTAAAIIGGAAISGIAGASASRSAGRAQQRAADQATAEQRRQYDLSRQDLAPYRQVGTQAINQLGSLYGFSPYQETAPTPYDGGGFDIPGLDGAASRFTNAAGGFVGRFNESRQPMQAGQPGQQAAAPGGMSAFFASPDYNFRRTEGMRGIEQSAAARGGAFSGNALRGITGFNSNLAAGEFGDYYNRLANLAGIGQTATNTGAQLGANFANQAGANAMAAGNARASGIMGTANSVGGAINSGLNNYLLYRGGYFTPPSGGSGGSGYGGIGGIR